jgi:hypothetical protein
MKVGASTADEAEITLLIKNHFEGMGWTRDIQPDWGRFSSDFLAGASLFPAARPVQIRTLEAFVERMKGIAAGALHTFEEHTLGMQILAFGNIAVALAASEMLENGTETNHDISAYLLVKNDGKWLIAAHAWDKATAERPVPDYLR